MSLITNFRYAARQLRKSPAFSIAVVATLGLCIGANTAVFTIVDRLFFRPPPYPDPQHLAVLTRIERAGGATDVNTAETGFQWELVRDHAKTLDGAVYASIGGVNLAAGNRVEYVSNERIGAGFFRVLGVRPFLGREFTREEDVPGGPPLAILSYTVWQQFFHSDRGIIGQTIQLRGAPYTVLGVMPAGFISPARHISGDDTPIGVWTPLHPTTTGEGANANYGIIARLKSDVTFAEANAELNSLMHDLFKQAKQAGTTIEEHAVPLQTGETLELRRSVHLMWGAVGLVLLIGCVNIAGLLLTRSASRAREIATRLALGASRTAILGELLAECILLAFGGGILGIVIGKYGLDALLRLNPGAFEIWGSIALDARVMGLMIAVALATSFLFGLFPALETTCVDLRSALSEAGRSTAGSRRQWKRQMLVFAEVALGVVLVVSAALLIRTFATLVGTDPGFDPHHVMTASASLQDVRYKTAAAGARLFHNSIERIEQIPGVESAAVSSTPPYGRALNDCVSEIDGAPLTQVCLTNVNYATPGMFHTLRMKLFRGNFFTEADTPNTAPVAVVNQAFVRRFLQKKPHPIGTIITLDGKNWRIVGVVSDVQQKNSWDSSWGPIDRFPDVYVPAAQFSDGLFAITNVWFSPVWLVRTRADIPGLPDAMRRALAQVDPQLPFSSFRTMDKIAGRSLQAQRYRATLFSALAGLGVLLAALGVYGLIAESVSQRTREMGIRVALGATVYRVIRTAALPGILLSISGVVTGLILAFFATRLLKSIIWGVKATDPMTFVTVALLLIAVATLASVIPALRLAHIDPAQTLRDE